MLIPRVKAKVIHIPGVIETKKKVGMKAESSAKFMERKCLTIWDKSNVKIQLLTNNSA
ncbi:hypothetical protein FORC36_3452 [Vibrio vulnificus]|uniref:Uncharacterized protein n=1 Tax=Vibrio vulnificus TaxID=672 RepID=A0AAN1UE19_VIBVL|nr:hypothetical protein FORC9_3446 [Vibrio vulnificus]ANH65323.1 hypothetical protein FORC16_3440 [Vibrio vulnificus]ANN28552.1 hypothetical protein FORC17_3489 [Vibrio vulnificus]ARN67969.1 hypothetical protein FORC36_3452 [Vibrio vulnificus]ASC59096.1 hypothetical protein FORC37_3402 [Vibrio vulnificus]